MRPGPGKRAVIFDVGNTLLHVDYDHVAGVLRAQGHAVDPAAVQAAEPDQAAPPEKGQEKEGVFVVEGGKASFRPVKTGIIGETEIEIGDGLKEGDEIVTGSYKTLRTLKDQAKIKVEVKKARS